MPHTKRAFDLMDSLTPLFKGCSPKSLLYVGWRHDCHVWWHRTFAPALGVEDIGIIEIFPQNYALAIDKAREGHFGLTSTRVIRGDVLEIQKYVSKGEYDIIFWDHGPEHVSLAALQEATPRLIEHAGKALIYCCPWGHWPQGAEGGNDHEEHANSVEPDQLSSLGMNYNTVGSSGQSGEGELVAWKIK